MSTLLKLIFAAILALAAALTFIIMSPVLVVSWLYK